MGMSICMWAFFVRTTSSKFARRGSASFNDGMALVVGEQGKGS